ncbi:altronate hydrolase [Caulobacter ginsengisoli]|uniref:Altronate hydrolase n=1 Tax=Caulobacter ginsengisoli TaxID=400775 RepID=A0ABU0ILT4_9CAUL|nr:altronate dehydratase family protein [Caulobacter ginsengisoli]MDQ0462331.1 altronate hydrolase [Caulobacter ginsengisoli]
MARALLRIDPADDVAVALRDIAVGETVDDLTALDAIPKGHKIALRDLPTGQAVRKYGHPIGKATTAIAAGSHVHSHNLATALGGEEGYAAPATFPAPVTATPAPGFMGYRRTDGRVGTRNEIWILCTVGCVAHTVRRIAEAANRQFAGRVEGVHAFTHPFGCSQLGDDLGHTRKLLGALASHPNAGGVLIVGLGCESNQLDALLAAAPGIDPSRLRSFTAQGEEDEIEAGLAAVEALVEIAERDSRVPCPVSDLVIGLKCGGSDGFSGLTANPLVGRIADKVSDGGGTSILTEIPEVFGAERLLMARATSPAVFEATVSLVNGFKRYFIDHGEPVSENPSPGNIAGGVTTLEEKSLGAVQKAGHAPLAQVLAYGERTHGPGLALLEAPGNDAVSSTALAAAGATVILFTTGRGTPLGFPAPTLKIATNSDLAARKPRWIDFDAGVVLEDRTMDQAADDLMALVLATASGQPTRAEQNGEREMAIWKTGVTL